MRKLPTFKEHAIADDAFGRGHALCPGCMEAVTFHEVGRATANGRKTILTIGTSCGEVSTLMYPNLIAWGRGEREPAAVAQSVGIIHDVFESAPTVAEAARDVSDALAELGAWRAERPNVVALSGDGGALSIGLRALLHTTYRRSRIAMFINMNEVYANTGFQYSPTATPHADASTAPLGLPFEPLDHLRLALAAGAGYVAQCSAAFAPLFAEVVAEALACPETAIVFVPSPCITGWKYEEGQTVELAKLASQTGLFPCFRKRRGQPGEVKHVPEKSRRPPVEAFLAWQRRFDHIVRMKDQKPVVVPGREADLAQIQAWADKNVERLEAMARDPSI